jgi:drug/metabolite transporter (DMT)-like permease
VTNNLKKWQTISILFLAAIIWGFAFVAQRAGMEHTGPFTFNGIRFLLGTISLLPVAFVLNRKQSRRPKPSRKFLFSGGLISGIALFAGASLQQVGIVHTSAGNAGLITTLYVVLVPVLGLFWKSPVNKQTWVGVLLSIFGLYLLSIVDSPTFLQGDAVVLLSAFFFALHVHLIGWISPKTNPIELSVIQFSVCSFLSLIMAVLTEKIDISGVKDAAIPILYSGIMSVGVAYTLQTVAQRKANPTHAALVLSSESVFAMIGGWMILNEGLTIRGAIGCMFMLGGIIISQLKFKENSPDGFIKIHSKQKS